MSFSRSLKARSGKIWEDGYNHPFVQELGQGILDAEVFQFYLLQDYVYLLQYAKAFALATVKAESEEVMAKLTSAQHDTLSKEMSLHRQYMADFGITPQQMEAVQPSLFNRTYTANILALGQTGDLAEIMAAMLPCAWTYSEYAGRLKTQYAGKLEGNCYRSWIDHYAAPDFEGSFSWFFDTLDDLMHGKTTTQCDRVASIFTSSVEFEYLFWDMAYKQEMSYHL